MVLECGGNGRAFFQPPARGNQWTNGGAGCAEWTGVPLKTLLAAAGLKPEAKFTGHFGGDIHLSGDPAKSALSRGMPIEKAMDDHTLVAVAMNGEPLTNIHGGPVRLVVPGWPGSLSSKWLNRILLRATPHDGQGMGGTSYRVPVIPIVPGATDDGKAFRDLTSMPVRSVITSPANGTRLPAGTREVALRGAAWDGDAGVERVDVSLDFGQRWQAVTMGTPKNRYDWVRWTHRLALPSDGYFELWVRATDRNGLTQSIVAGNWNPQGYGGNPINRIAVLVA
jgi:DMSO/TMAO reductase YedYZ molybdopterin-dependent catalytic subunit